MNTEETVSDVNGKLRGVRKMVRIRLLNRK